MTPKASMDDDYEKQLKETKNEAPKVARGDRPVGEVLFKILCGLNLLIGLLMIGIGFYNYHRLDGTALAGMGLEDRSAFRSLIVCGVVVILYPFVLWISMKIVRWLLGLDDVIAALERSRSK